ncbi:MAG TPA: protein kinase [Dehalococcoidia bacterium]|nr:protein kinase [Dehalococcoidia bacterium]
MLPFDTLVLNKYRILRSSGRRDGLLGRGTFGNVYLAHEELADRDVAIKELGLDSSELEEQQEEALHRFLTEGRLGLKIRHPNLLEIYAIEPYEDGYLLVMQLAPKGDLKALLAQGRPEISRTVAIGAGIARGLHAAHLQGIVHRDLKPGNVFMMEDGTPKVADFGVAHIPQAVGGYLSLTRTGFQPGTVIYMSPEQAAGRRIDHRSDLYSLAVILFELLTGSFYVDIQRCRELAQSQARNTPALQELRFFQVFSEVAFEGPLARPSDKNPGVPPWLDAVVMKGLARDPEERWQSGAEFAEALLKGGTVETATVSGPSLDRTMLDPGTPPSLGGRTPRPVTPVADPPSAISSTVAEPTVVAPVAPTIATPAAPPAKETVAPAAALVDAEATYVKPPRPARTNGATTPAPVAGNGVEVAPAADTPGDTTFVRPAAPTPEAGWPARPAFVGGATPPAANGVAFAPPSVVVAPVPAPRRRSRLLLFGAPAAVVLILLIAGAVVLLSHGSKKAPAAPTVVAATVSATAPVTVATTAATPATTPAPTATPLAPPRQAADVPDAQLLRPGATLVQRVNLPGQNGDPGYIAVESTGAAGAGGCSQTYVDLMRPQAGDKVSNVWDGTQAPQGSPLLQPVQKSDAGCYPAVKLFSAFTPQAGSVPALLVSVVASNGSQQIALVQGSGDLAKLLGSLTTTPGTDVSVQDGTPPVLKVTENAYPSASSGLQPDYSRPLGRLALVETWQNGSFQPSGPQLTPNCLTGTITRKGNNAIEWSCPDGSPGPVSAAAVDGNTTYDSNVSFDDLNVGDDVTVALADGSTAPQDPLAALPTASSIKSSAAATRKAPTPAPTRAPSSPSGTGTQSGSPSSGSGTRTTTPSQSTTTSPSYTAPQQTAPQQTAPQQTTPQYTPPQPTEAPSSSGAGVGTGSSSRSGSGAGVGAH